MHVAEMLNKNCEARPYFVPNFRRSTICAHTQAHPSFSILHTEKWEGLGDEITYVTSTQTDHRQAIDRLTKVTLMEFK